MKHLKDYKTFENSSFNKASELSVWTVMKQKIPATNYASMVRKILEEKKSYFSRSPHMSLRVLVGRTNDSKKKLLEELFTKIPTNISIYKYIISQKLDEVISSVNHNSSKPLDVEIYNKIRTSLYETDKKIKSNKVRLNSVTDRNFLKLIYTYRNYIFNFDTINEMIKLLYQINKNSYMAEYSVENYFNNMYGGKYTATDSSKEDDIRYGVDKNLVDSDGKIVHRIQVKRATEVNLSPAKGRLRFDSLFVNNSNLDINEIMGEHNKWDILSIVSGNVIYILKKEDIKGIKTVKNNNFMINYTKEKVIIDEIKSSDKSISDLNFLFK